MSPPGWDLKGNLKGKPKCPWLSSRRSANPIVPGFVFYVFPHLNFRKQKGAVFDRGAQSKAEHPLPFPYPGFMGNAEPIPVCWDKALFAV